MARTERVLSHPGFVADPASVSRRGLGLQPDWDNITTTDDDGKKVVRAGTPIGILAHGSKFRPRVATTNPAIGILETDAHETDPVHTGYGVLVEGNLYENFLPDATGTPKTLAGTIKTELTNAGCRFYFQQYVDTR